MRFSRYQLDQLAKVNSVSINTLISKQKELHALNTKRGLLQSNIKKVTSSKAGSVSKGSSLLMGRINTRLLIKLGYSDIGALVLEMEENDQAIAKLNDEVKDINSTIQDSVNAVDGIDVNVDMSEQVTQEIILDSDIEEVKANSSEILLMLSQSKGAAEIYKQAVTQIDKNEDELSDILSGINKKNKQIFDDSSADIDELNDSTNLVNSKLDKLTSDKGELTMFEKGTKYLNNLSTIKKNAILAGTFVGFLLAGVGASKKTKPVDSNGKRVPDDKV